MANNISHTKDEDKKKELQATYDLHLRKAEAAYDPKRKYKQLALSNENIRCVIFDLQQCLPTPDISTGVVYYLRQLYTYNLTVVDVSTNKTHCFMWHEGEAKRGANEIASALFVFIMDHVPPTATELYAFSDSCTGQNRNSIMSGMFQVALETHASLKKITHIFLVRGHTRLECNNRHSAIGASRKRVKQINCPSGWYNVCRQAGKIFEVTEMSDKLHKFSALLEVGGPLINREKKENGEKLYWTKTNWFQYSSDSPGIVGVKSSFSAPLEMYNMIRGLGKNKKLASDWWQCVPLAEPGNAISEEKKKNLMSLLVFLDSAHHQFYRDLKSDNSPPDLDPDLPSEDEDDPGLLLSGD
ncbi:hypothetical protein ONE63_005152 [Megalurothrips usitatus]|uniref:Uncharacterized protein n=1 Tax=Megalurothrips usitatus TaxID=439358 RepID=A0AAV7Y1C7_9NEOP|nr:hypothetical protein ONE63_005152 [Megalurothrips usitatus]